MPVKNGQPENLATTVIEVSDRVSILVREEIELAKAEMTQKVTSIARGAAAAAAGAVFGVFAVVFLLLTLAWGLNDLLNSIVARFPDRARNPVDLHGGRLPVCPAMLRVGAPTPTMAIDEAKKIRETVAEREL